MPKTQTFYIKCEQCGSIIGESTVNIASQKCSLCFQEHELQKAINNGNNFDAEELKEKRPQKFKSIVREAVISNPDKLFEFSFSKEIEDSKKEIIKDWDTDTNNIVEKIKESEIIATDEDEIIKSKIRTK